MTPEDHRRATAFVRTQANRSGIGGMTPTTFATGYLYAGMGWTTVNEAAVPILFAKHTHEELRDIPIVDKCSMVLMANNEILVDLLEAGEYERARALSRLADLGLQSLRHQGRESGRRRFPGKRARTAASCRRPLRAIATSRRARSSRSWLASSTTWACLTRCTCTAIISVHQATSQPPSRR